MDKLKPILAQKFWILSALCLLLPLTGWWLATGAMAIEYTARKKAIDDAFSGIPQPGPNKKWTERVEVLNKDEEQKVKQTGVYLWNQQQELMTWPEVVKAGVEKGGFRGEVDAKTRSEYRSAYEQELVDLHQVVKPFDATTGEGLVEFPMELIPTLSWGTSPIPPSSQEMWDSQEDIWLFRTLLQGVFNINQEFQCETVLDSKIKQIVMIELRGGTPGGAKAVAEAAGAGAGGGPGGAMPDGAGAGAEAGAGANAGKLSGPGGGMGSLLGGSSGGADTLSASFDPTEQLGSDEVASEGAEAGAEGAGAAAGPGGAGAGGGPGAMMPGRGAGGGGSTVKKRYIDETPRFKTRGFYMELVLDHRTLPEFIAELSDSKWPLRVIRVQQVDVDLADIGADTALGAGGAAGAGRSGMGRPAGGGMGRPAGGGMGAGRTAMPRAAVSRPPGPMGGGARQPAGGTVRPGGNDGGVPENAVDLQSAMTDPYLVNVALSGIITLYLPPESVAGAPAGTEGSPATTPVPVNPTAAATAPPAAGTAPDDGGTAAPAAVATPSAVPPTGAAVPVTNGTAPAKPAATTPPAGTPPTDSKPAADSKPTTVEKPTSDAKPAVPPATEKPTAPPAGSANPSASPAKPDKPAAAGAKP